MCGVVVSVPFRGSCSEMNTTVFLINETNNQFPSPFGVHVLKCEHCGVDAIR